MSKTIYSLSTLFFLLVVALSVSAQDLPTLSGKATSVMIPGGNRAILYEQMSNAGTNSLTSQNFEASFDIYDSFGADDFVVTAGYQWSIESIDVLGAYYNGVGPANSFNVFFYSNSGGLPGTLVAQALNASYTDPGGLGSASITISPAIVIPEGPYWVSVQCNMDFGVGGQYGWTEQMPTNFESAFQNPGGGFGTPCSSWGYRVATCLVGTAPYTDLSFRLNGTAIPIPVELTSFTAIANQGVVELNWITATETNNQGFSIERSSGGEYQAVGYVAGHGTTTETQVYTFTDNNVNVGSYTYRLKQIDFDGTFEYSKAVEVDVTAPAEFGLGQNYPNPFNPSTKISFSLAADSRVTLSVFNLLGEEVVTVLNSNMIAGNHSVDFNAAGLNSGVYFYRIDAQGIDGTSFTSVKKMILTK